MNRDEAARSLHLATNDLILATASVFAAESVPSGTMKFEFGGDEVTLLTDGVVIFKPEENKQWSPGPVGPFAILSPPYPPVGTKPCSCCKGTGTIEA